jgi:hypothetical protein
VNQSSVAAAFPCPALDPLLADLAPALRGQGDLLLDLRAAAAHSPGRCIRCYFQLLASAPASARPRLTPLRTWLEARIEAAAHDDSGRLLDTFPVNLDDDDLESCCRRLMRLVAEDRTHASPAIRLGFRHRPAHGLPAAA